jgi:hypothetical protein
MHICHHDCYLLLDDSSLTTNKWMIEMNNEENKKMIENIRNVIDVLPNPNSLVANVEILTSALIHTCVSAKSPQKPEKHLEGILEILAAAFTGILDKVTNDHIEKHGPFTSSKSKGSNLH